MCWYWFPIKNFCRDALIFSSPELCPWRANHYVVTQSLASVSVGMGVSTVFWRLSASVLAQCLSFQWCASGELHCLLTSLVLKVCRRINHCKIQVKFDISNHLQNFGWVMALFRLSFCWCVDIGFRSLTFAWMHWFYWKFAERYIIVKYRSSLILAIIDKFLPSYGPFST